MADPTVHTIALIKGAVEGDPYKHFGSILAIGFHARPAVERGLIEWRDGQPSATDRGREFYTAHGLGRLPGGRANAWADAADHAVAAIVAEASRG